MKWNQCKSRETKTNPSTVIRDSLPQPSRITPSLMKSLEVEWNPCKFSELISNDDKSCEMRACLLKPSRIRPGVVKQSGIHASLIKWNQAESCQVYWNLWIRLGFGTLSRITLNWFRIPLGFTRFARISLHLTGFGLISLDLHIFHSIWPDSAWLQV